MVAGRPGSTIFPMKIDSRMTRAFRGRGGKGNAGRCRGRPDSRGARRVIASGEAWELCQEWIGRTLVGMDLGFWKEAEGIKKQ